MNSPPMPKQGSSSFLQYKYVHHLFSSESTSWDINILREIFDDNTVNYILRIPIHVNQEDRLIWLLERSGSFFVKSTYRKMYEEDQVSDTVGVRMVKCLNPYGNFQFFLGLNTFCGRLLLLFSLLEMYSV